MTRRDSTWTNSARVVMPALERKSRTYSSYFVRVPGARWAATKFRISASRGASRGGSWSSGRLGARDVGQDGETGSFASIALLYRHRGLRALSANRRKWVFPFIGIMTGISLGRRGPGRPELVISRG